VTYVTKRINLFDKKFYIVENGKLTRMKLRIRGNSLRLRLTKSEVARFGAAGNVEDAVEFGGDPPQRLIYALVAASDIENTTARFENDRITVFVPKLQADRWTKSNRVGLEDEKPIAENRTLRILIEKDFACLEPREGEEDVDTFDHPFENQPENRIVLNA
jgi:hypothetical protein